MRGYFYSITLGLVFLLSSCVQDTKKRERPLVVCTTNIIGDALETLLEKDADVVCLMGPGVDPHLYKASQKDLEYLQNLC